MVARGMISCVDISREAFAERAFVAWAPLFHMTATDYSMTTLTNGGKVVVLGSVSMREGLVEIVAREEIGYLTLMPGMIEQVAAELRGGAACGRAAISVIGAMADLVPRHQLAEITTLLQAPYRQLVRCHRDRLATGRGRGVIPIGAAPDRVAGNCRAAYCPHPARGRGRP